MHCHTDVKLRLFCLVCQRCTLLPPVVSLHTTCQNNYHINLDRVGYLGNPLFVILDFLLSFLKFGLFFQEFRLYETRLIHVQNYIELNDVKS